jgi:hypothetical protein
MFKLLLLPIMKSKYALYLYEHNQNKITKYNYIHEMYFPQTHAYKNICPCVIKSSVQENKILEDLI